MQLRVLLLESINDRLSRDRAALLAFSPDLDGITIEHCYAVNPTQEDVKGIDNFAPPLAEAAAWDSRGAPLPEAEFKEDLEAAVLNFQPHAIMLHTGMAFHRHREIFIRVLSEIKRKYPHMKMGYQYRLSDQDLVSCPVFDSDEVTRQIEMKLFGRIPPK